MLLVNAFTCTGAYAVLILSGLKRVENRRRLPTPVPCRSNVGMWRLPSALADEVEGQFAGEGNASKGMRSRA